MIHLAITVPCAVDPEERRLPVAQAKPEPAKVAPAPPELDDIGADDIGADDIGADDIGADDIEADDIGADDIGAEEPVPDAAALEDAPEAELEGAATLDEPAEVLVTAATALEAPLLSVLLADEAGVLLSLPQALRVSAPAANRATRALVRVIFTPCPPRLFSFPNSHVGSSVARHYGGAVGTLSAQHGQTAGPG